MLKTCMKLNLSRIALYSQESSANKNYDTLVKGRKVVVFMKGTPDAPRCGFSNAVVQILRFHGVDKFDSHDVLSDEELRQGIDPKVLTTGPEVPKGGLHVQYKKEVYLLWPLHHIHEWR